MHSDDAPNGDIFQWYDSLSDREQCIILDVLRLIALQSGVVCVPGRLDKGSGQSLLTKDTLDVDTRILTQISLN